LSLYIRMKKVLSLINYIIGMTTVIQSLIRKDINVSEHEFPSAFSSWGPITHCVLVKGFQGFKAVKMVNMDAISIGKPGRRT
jgi:hypothetical protein